ncbi:hypothetical protein BDA99DRAFT_583632 [Phascolomyces articulosus]|uniref:Uncharacterized protein n=1 Tax=Phascolomyces articulosus TaxID=60185 RepID=A0AAD5PDY3_9FUNG|nr:hypothetical protein BDA99DRAFT_583632 [Phascolomyces articulosus]
MILSIYDFECSSPSKSLLSMNKEFILAGTQMEKTIKLILLLLGTTQTNSSRPPLSVSIDCPTCDVIWVKLNNLIDAVINFCYYTLSSILNAYFTLSSATNSEEYKQLIISVTESFRAEIDAYEPNCRELADFSNSGGSFQTTPQVYPQNFHIIIKKQEFNALQHAFRSLRYRLAMEIYHIVHNTGKSLHDDPTIGSLTLDGIINLEHIIHRYLLSYRHIGCTDHPNTDELEESITIQSESKLQNFFDRQINGEDLEREHYNVAEAMRICPSS